MGHQALDVVFVSAHKWHFAARTLRSVHGFEAQYFIAERGQTAGDGGNGGSPGRGVHGNGFACHEW